jgi:hypothetical protein
LPIRDIPLSGTSRRYIVFILWRTLLKRSKSGAKATALSRKAGLSRPPSVVELREASELRRVHRRFSLSSPARFWLPMAVQIKPQHMKTYTKSIALASLTLALAGSAWSAHHRGRKMAGRV